MPSLTRVYQNCWLRRIEPGNLRILWVLCGSLMVKRVCYAAGSWKKGAPGVKLGESPAIVSAVHNPPLVDRHFLEFYIQIFCFAIALDV